MINVLQTPAEPKIPDEDSQDDMSCFLGIEAEESDESEAEQEESER
jgi:hypothetical protein